MDIFLDHILSFWFVQIWYHHQTPIWILWILAGIQQIQCWCPIFKSSHYQRHRMLIVAAKKMHCKMSVLQVWHSMCRIFQVQQWRILSNLPIDSVGHCMRYPNIKVLPQPNFPLYWQNPRTYMGKSYQRKPVYSHILPNVHIIEHKHYWTRIIDIYWKYLNF